MKGVKPGVERVVSITFAGVNKELKKKSMTVKIVPKSTGVSVSDKSKEVVESVKVPDRILGATIATGELIFLVKWKGSDVVDLIPASTANKVYPQTVIRYYEQRICWVNPNAEKGNR